MSHMLRLSKGDFAIVGAVGIAVIVTRVLTRRMDPPGFLTFGVSVTLIVLLVLEVYRRLQIQIKEGAQEAQVSIRNSYRQTEALHSVMNTIRPTTPLPLTTTWSAFPDLLNQLCALVLARRPGLIFEAGSGVSTLTMAYCLRRLGAGRIVSLENDPHFAVATREMLAQHGLTDLATVVDAPIKEAIIAGERCSWYDVTRVPSTEPIELLFVDGPHGLTQKGARYPALPVLSSRLAADCVIVLDDGARADETAIAERWSREFGLKSDYLPLEKGAYVLTRCTSVHTAPPLHGQNR